MNLTENGDVTTVAALVGQVESTDTKTPAATNVIGLWGQLNLRDMTATSAISGYFPAPVFDTGSATQSLSWLATGHCVVGTGARLYLEGSLGANGDTYLTYSGGIFDTFIDGTNLLRKQCNSVSSWCWRIY